MCDCKDSYFLRKTKDERQKNDDDALRYDDNFVLAVVIVIVIVIVAKRIVIVFFRLSFFVIHEKIVPLHDYRLWKKILTYAMNV